MDCEQAREQLLQGEPTADGALSTHLSICRACSVEAGRQAWLDTLLRRQLVVAPPPAAARAALRAALAAAPGPSQPRTIRAERHIGADVPPKPARRGPSLAAYLLAGVVLAVITGLSGLDAAGPLSSLAVTFLDVFGLLLSSPVIWLAVPPDTQGEPWISWVALIVLAWGLRQALTSTSAASAHAATRSE